MRVIAGRSGGIPIKVPRETTRPTTDRVRESIFSSLGDRVENAVVLDLFAGSGSLGIEALSRGAARACFVDESRKACEVITQNLARTRLQDRGSVKCARVGRFLKGAAKAEFDLVFADPPYARDETREELLEDFLRDVNLAACLSPEGLLVLESSGRVPLPDPIPWRSLREKTYGDTRVTFLVPHTD